MLTEMMVVCLWSAAGCLVELYWTRRELCLGEGLVDVGMDFVL